MATIIGPGWTMVLGGGLTWLAVAVAVRAIPAILRYPGSASAVGEGGWQRLEGAGDGSEGARPPETASPRSPAKGGGAHCR